MQEIRKHESVSTVAIIGAGLIGAGWAAQFLLSGYNVIAWDPADKWSDKLLAHLRTAFVRLGVCSTQQAALIGKVSFASSCEEAAETADFVQESGPEQLETKRSTLQQISAVTPPDTVIASSTSGLLMSELQEGCKTPARLAVGHPFHPVYLMPLVEVVGGRDTSPKTLEWLCEFYRSINKKPVMCDRENVGFIANRLQEAMFREALHMVAAGDATVAQIDDAVRFGPGLRWAFMGPFLTYHLAGGHGGMRAFFQSFGDTLEQPYSRLRAPELTSQLIEKVIKGCEQKYGNQSVEELEEWRDTNIQCLISDLQPIKTASDT